MVEKVEGTGIAALPGVDCRSLPSGVRTTVGHPEVEASVLAGVLGTRLGCKAEARPVGLH